MVRTKPIDLGSTSSGEEHHLMHPHPASHCALPQPPDPKLATPGSTPGEPPVPHALGARHHADTRPKALLADRIRRERAGRRYAPLSGAGAISRSWSATEPGGGEESRPILRLAPTGRVPAELRAAAGAIPTLDGESCMSARPSPPPTTKPHTSWSGHGPPPDSTSQRPTTTRSRAPTAPPLLAPPSSFHVGRERLGLLAAAKALDARAADDLAGRIGAVELPSRRTDIEVSCVPMLESPANAPFLISSVLKERTARRPRLPAGRSPQSGLTDRRSSSRSVRL